MIYSRILLLEDHRKNIIACTVHAVPETNRKLLFTLHWETIIIKKSIIKNLRNIIGKLPLENYASSFNVEPLSSVNLILGCRFDKNYRKKITGKYMIEGHCIY
jgi:hypothetical protein